MVEPPHEDRAVKPRARTRTWPWILGYWVIQSIVIYLLFAALIAHAGTVHGRDPGPFGESHAGRDAIGSFDFGEYGQILVERGYLIVWAVTCAVIAALQAIFVWPVRRPRAARRSARPLWVSLAIAGGLGVLLCTGLVLAAVHVLSLYFLERVLPTVPDWAAWTLLASTVLPSWTMASVLLWRFCRRPTYEQTLSRVVSRLFLGTMIEFIAAIPLDVMIRRKEDCYCFSGSFFAILVAFGVGLFALGPAMLLPVLTRRRVRWYAGRCEVCGYDMTGLKSADRCPECGTGWKSEPTPA